MAPERNTDRTDEPTHIDHIYRIAGVHYPRANNRWQAVSILIPKKIPLPPAPDSISTFGSAPTQGTRTSPALYLTLQHLQDHRPLFAFLDDTVFCCSSPDPDSISTFGPPPSQGTRTSPSHYLHTTGGALEHTKTKCHKTNP